MKLISYLLSTFVLGATSVFVCPSRYCRRGDSTPLVGSSEKPARWLAIQEPSRHALRASDDIYPRSHEAVTKRSVDDDNQRFRPRARRRRPEGAMPDTEYIRNWRAKRLAKINDPNTPPEEKARLQKNIDEAKAKVRRMNRSINPKEAERVLNREEMRRFRILQGFRNKFRIANRAMKEKIAEAKREGRELTDAEQDEWDLMLAGLRAYAALSREAARRLDQLEKSERKKRIREDEQEPRLPAPQRGVSKKAQQPQAPGNQQQSQDGGPSSDIHSSRDGHTTQPPPHKDFSLDLNSPIWDAVKQKVQTTGSDLGNAVRRVESVFPPAGSRSLFPGVGPALPVMGRGFIL